MTASQFGVTLGQSLGGGLVIGSTLKLVRAGAAVAGNVSGADLLDRASDLEISAETHGDIDMGAMVSASHARIGIGIKHLTEPEFGDSDAGTRFVLERQVRAGLAVLTGARGALDGVTMAFDIDLTKTPTATGEAQHVAGGVEAWLFRRRLGMRGGVSRNIAEPSGSSTSAGLSLAMRSSLHLDGAFTFGSDTSRDGWDVSFRTTF